MLTGVGANCLEGPHVGIGPVGRSVEWPPQVFVFPSQVFVFPSQVFVFPPQVFVFPPQVRAAVVEAAKSIP
jgi:hypothetical protein